MGFKFKRFMASVVDTVIVLIVTFIVWYLAVLSGNYFTDGDNSLLYGSFLVIMFYGFKVAYHTIFEYYKETTLGKNLMSLRVECIYGEEVEWKRHLKRNPMRAVDEGLLIGLVLVLIRDQRIGDMISDLEVVEVEYEYIVEEIDVEDD